MDITASVRGTREHSEDRELDADIRRELHRGATFRVSLPPRLEWLLNRIVLERGSIELQLADERRRPGALRAIHRRVNRLQALGYVRTDQGRLFPTVAGIGAVLSPSTQATGMAQPEVLRELRRTELGRAA